MRFVIQVAENAGVEIEGSVKGSIKRGMVVLIGVSNDDTPLLAEKMVDKMLKLRIFPDENGKTNINLADYGGGLLLVSQFTLYADLNHGNRPSFVKAGAPDHANSIYEHIIEYCRSKGVETATGEFGADMKVTLTNMGPFTVIMDSKEIFPDKNN